MERYRITYPNGVTVVKTLISDEIYNSDILPAIESVKYMRQSLSASTFDKYHKTLMDRLDADYGENRILASSPLGKAISSGVLNLPNIVPIPIKAERLDLTIQEAIVILKRHNDWRRGSDVDMIEPSKIGNAIDVVVAYIESKLSKK